MSEKISVLIPTFNREKYIKESLESILNQTYKNLEVVIYDDGSTDKTCQIIESFKDNRIKLIKGKINKGVGYSRNKLLEACNTRYACWHDSDDVSDKNRIKLQYNVTNPNSLIFCRWVWITLNRKNQWIKKTTNNSTNAFATIMFPVDKDIKFVEKMQIGGEDWDWIKRMELKYKKRIIVPQILYHTRFHENRIGAWKKKFRKQIPKEILNKLTYKELIKYYKEHYGK